MKTFKTLIDVTNYFSDEQKCIDYVKKIRWKNNQPICPHCGHKEVYVYADNKLYKCKSCKKQFTIKVGTIFEDSKVSLSKWFVAIYLLTSHKKGISSLQLSKDLGVTQKTAWFILHRIRYAQRTKSFNAPLKNVVEVDETFVGGKETNKHKNKRKHGGATSPDMKTPVMGLLERGGEVRAMKIERANKEVLIPEIIENVDSTATVVTDNFAGYKPVSKLFHHEIVSHSTGQYVNGIYSTNGLENFWSLFKRGVYGIYHSISSKHTNPYVDEFKFRFNTRKIGEIERFNLFLQDINGHLKYKHLIS